MTMGQLKSAAPTPRRARSTEDKQARADAILKVGGELCATAGFGGWTMSDLAARAGCAKGTVFLYFPTKETLGLALLERRLGEWFDDVDARLARACSRAPLDAARTARLLASSIE